MEKLMELLQASGFGKPDDEHPPDVVRKGNVLHVCFEQRGDRGDPFTREERAEIRNALETLKRIAGNCPIAKRALVEG